MNIKTWLLAGLAVFTPIKAVIITVGILIVADFIFGVWAAKKRGEKITSKRLRDTVTKMCVYQMAVLTGFLGETYLLEGIVPVTKLVAAIIGAVELKSLFENYAAISGVDFASIITKLGSQSTKDKKDDGKDESKKE